jgi:tetratricopeptide (TPR) repeat protein
MNIKRNIIEALKLFTILACAILPSSHALTLSAGPQALETGKLIPKVICRSDAQQSYALFLPSSYSRDKRWPILYCFDPGARGQMPVERFKEAAEKYGYIVVGSNNSRNGSTEAPLAAVKAMLDDTQARFSIDERRVYTAGFSGGARVATSVGYGLAGSIAGVIACGAGFPQGLSPSRSTPFPLFGTAGVEDFNFPEVKQLVRALDGFGIASRVAVFEGAHDWPPSAVCVEAIEWMELQAMKSGRRVKDERLIGKLFDKQVERARGQEAAGKLYDAFNSQDAIANDFKGLKDVSQFEKRSAELKELKEVKQALKQEAEMEKEQARRTNELFTLRNSLRDSESSVIALADLKRNIASLKKKIDEKEMSAERIVARRVLNQLLVSLYEGAREFTNRKQYDQAAQNFSIIALIAPDNPRVHYNLACAYALNKDKSRAIEALKKSVEKGFNDRAALESDRELDSIREDADYKRIVEDLKKKS